MPKHRRAEAIWVEATKRWQINVQRDGKRKTFASPTPGRKGKHEAEAKADDWLEAGQPDDIRFDAAWSQYLDHVQTTTGTSNYHDNESIGRNWFLPTLKDKRLSTLKLADLQAIVTSAGTQGKSRRTCKNIRDKLSAFFAFAKDQKWPYSVDPSRIKLPTQAHVGERRVIQPDQLRRLFADDMVSYDGKDIHCFYIHAFRLAVSLGFRRGEICGFKRSDYDGVTLTVRRSVNRFREETQGKNDNARRVIVLPAYARRILDAQLDMLRSQGIISPWLFPAEDGSQLDPGVFYEWWRKYSTQHGMRTSLHELRHTFVSICKAEMPETLLKDIVGHSASMDTGGVYGHEIDGEKQRAANILDDIFARVLGE